MGASRANYANTSPKTPSVHGDTGEIVADLASRHAWKAYLEAGFPVRRSPIVPAYFLMVELFSNEFWRQSSLAKQVDGVLPSGRLTKYEPRIVVPSCLWR